MTPDAGKLAMVCFEVRNAAHLFHLKTSSYAEHKTLDKFYHEVIELADAYIEAWQGVYGKIKEFPDELEFLELDTPDELVMKFRKWLVQNRPSGRPELENLYDEIIGLADSTLYKLKYLS